jgi:hypothetical protein
MPAATAMKERQEIVKRREKGESFAQIAREMRMSYATVRNVWQFYQKYQHLEPNYAACAKTEVRKAQEIYEQAIALKREHLRWGAGLIWVELAESFEEKSLPSERTLQRWFHRAGLAQSLNRTKVARLEFQRGVLAHDVWAMDAKESIPLGDGSYGSWLLISDEGSGAVLESTAFPPEEME